MKNRRPIVFLAWGDKQIQLVADGIHESPLPQLPICLVTDSFMYVAELSGNVEVSRYVRQLSDKAKRLTCLPVSYKTSRRPVPRIAEHGV